MLHYSIPFDIELVQDKIKNHFMIVCRDAFDPDVAPFSVLAFGH